MPDHTTIEALKHQLRVKFPNAHRDTFDTITGDPPAGEDAEKTQIDRNDDTQATQGVEQKSTIQRKFALNPGMRNSMKATLEPSEVQAVIDTREHHPPS